MFLRKLKFHIKITDKHIFLRLPFREFFCLNSKNDPPIVLLGCQCLVEWGMIKIAALLCILCVKRRDTPPLPFVSFSIVIFFKPTCIFDFFRGKATFFTIFNLWKRQTPPFLALKKIIFDYICAPPYYHFDPGVWYFFLSGPT